MKTSHTRKYQKGKPMEKHEFYIETCFYHATISLTTSTGTSKPNLLTHTKNKKTTSNQLPKKNGNKEKSVTENEDDGSETGEIIVFTPREIHICSKEKSENIKIKEKECQQVDRRVDLSIEIEKSGQELPREKVVRPK